MPHAPCPLRVCYIRVYLRLKTSGGLEMEIKVLGPGCANCHKMEEMAKAAVKELGIDAQVVKITDVGEIAMNGILSTPGLIVNGKVKHTGKPLPSLEKVKEMIKAEA
jgi:small redox-active disulfide protein 2